MLVLPVAGVHDMGRGRRGDELRRADLRMTNDNDVWVVCAERERRVAERLTLVDRRAGRANGHRVRGEALRGELEARERARRGLVEEVHDESATKGGQLLHLAVERALERPRRVEDPIRVGARQVRDAEEMP